MRYTHASYIDSSWLVSIPIHFYLDLNRFVLTCSRTHLPWFWTLANLAKHEPMKTQLDLGRGQLALTWAKANSTLPRPKVTHIYWIQAQTDSFGPRSESWLYVGLYWFSLTLVNSTCTPVDLSWLWLGSTRSNLVWAQPNSILLDLTQPNIL